MQSDQCLFVRCIDCVTPIVFIPEIARLLLISVAEQTGLCPTWSSTHEDRFSHDVTLIYVNISGTPTIPVIPPVSKGGAPGQSLPSQPNIGLPGQPAPLPNFAQAPLVGPGKTICSISSVFALYLEVNVCLSVISPVGKYGLQGQRLPSQPNIGLRGQPAPLVGPGILRKKYW